MALVPHGLGLFGLFIAIILQMSFGFRSSVAQGRREKLFVFITFLAVLVQLFYLSTIDAGGTEQALQVFWRTSLLCHCNHGFLFVFTLQFLF